MCIQIYQFYIIRFFSLFTSFFPYNQRYRDGVVVGADSRTSVSGYVSNRVATKVSFILEDDFGIYALPPSSQMQLNSSFLKHKIKDSDTARESEVDLDLQEKENNQYLDSLLPISASSTSSTCCICRSGSAADTQYIADVIRHQLLRRKILHSRSSCVSDAAHLIKNYIKNNNNGSDNLSASLICAGYDHIQDDGIIYSIDLGGTIMEQKCGWACNGSGSTYILGLIDDQMSLNNMKGQDEDNNNKESSTLSMSWNEEEAVAFVKKAIGLAMERDGSSGGVIRIFVIDRNGKKSILHIPDFNLAKNNVHNLKDTNLSKFAPAKRR